MADERLDIEINIGQQGDGAQKAVADLNNVKAAAADAGDSLKTSADSFAQAQRDMAHGGLGELTDELTGASKAAKDADPSLQGLSTAISGMNQAARGGPDALFGLGRAAGILKGDLANLAKQVGAVGAGLAVGFKVGDVIFKNMVSPIWDAVEAGKRATQKFADDTAIAMSGIGRVKVNFEGLTKGLDEVREKIKEVEKEAAEATKRAEAARKVDRAGVGAREAELRLAEKRELIGAGDNREMQAVIKAKYDEQVRQLKLAQEQSERDQRILELKDEYLNLSSEEMALREKIHQLERTRAEAMSRYGSLDSDAARKEAAGVAISAQSAIVPAQAELASLEQKLESLSQSIVETEKERSKAQSDATIATLDSAEKLTSSTRDLEKAIRDQEARVTAAQQALAGAQAGGDMAAQGAAYESLQAEQAMLDQFRGQLQAAQQIIREGGADLGTAVAEVGAAVRSSAATSSAALRESSADIVAVADAESGKVRAAGDSAKADLSGAADKVVQATDQATGRIGSGVEQLGTAIGDGFDRVAASVERIALSVDSKLANLEGRVAQAEADADLALRQNRTRPR